MPTGRKLRRSHKTPQQPTTEDETVEQFKPSWNDRIMNIFGRGPLRYERRNNTAQFRAQSSAIRLPPQLKKLEHYDCNDIHDLDIHSKISAADCLIVIEGCENLRTLSVVLGWDVKHPLNQPHHMQRLGSLCISTTIQLSENFLNSIRCPALRTLSLKRDSLTIGPDEGPQSIGFKGLIERSGCHLYSLSLSNMFATDEELTGLLKSRNMDQLRALAVRDDGTASNGKKRQSCITDNVVDALTSESNMVWLNDLTLSPCSSKDGKLYDLVELRSRNSLFFFTYSSMQPNQEDQELKDLVRRRSELHVENTAGKVVVVG
ncbi:hypothetical protein C0989_004921 [Termitomyces sp. Mn162]|nr:hypothetical protein C0989_004921 [Termitomyces sp. Mn162]